MGLLAMTHPRTAFNIVVVAPAIVRPLRAAILRPGRPAHESVYPLDEHPETRHFAAIEHATGQVVGSASVFHQSVPTDDPHASRVAGDNDPWRGDRAWRLRGMTVIERMRGRDCGAALLAAAIKHAAAHEGRCLWFHGRASARGFYERFGFSAIGPTYDTPHIGEHVFMCGAILPLDANAPM